MSAHEHVWRAYLHSDGCHHYQNLYQCLCGAQTAISGERQMVRRGRIAEGAYMALEGCERCDALIAGARRKPTLRHVIDPAAGDKTWRRVRLKP